MVWLESELFFTAVLFNLNPLQTSQHGFISLSVTVMLFWLIMSLLQWVLWRDRTDVLLRSGITAIAQTAAWYFFPALLGETIDKPTPILLCLLPIIAVAIGCGLGFLIDRSATVLAE
jgi:hypothetical protein